MSLLLFGLIGTTVLGTVALDLIDDDDDETPPPQEEEGQELRFDGSDVLNGTAGDDTLPEGQDATLAPEQINLLGGDDTAHIDIDWQVTVSGGDGDDTLQADGVLNTLLGEAGNDTLTGDDSNKLYGGAGDDVINFNHGTYDQGEAGIADGGDGDDTLNVCAPAIVPEMIQGDMGGVEVTGGEGADTFNITYQMNTIENEEPEDVMEGRFITVTDFDPTQDNLVIEVKQTDTTEDRSATAEMEQVEENGMFKSSIKLTFAATEEALEATNYLTVFSTVPFTLNDIRFIGV
jgi:Ca2+-binding RTX toxin-like protein